MISIVEVKDPLECNPIASCTRQRSVGDKAETKEDNANTSTSNDDGSVQSEDSKTSIVEEEKGEIKIRDTDLFGFETMDNRDNSLVSR